VPPALIEQLKPGGKLVAPVGRGFGQELVVIGKDRAGKLTRRAVLPVRFVPMVPAERRH
jgi:protein-L-isoaspartate(D-aspartate) O-methyltransferase